MLRWRHRPCTPPARATTPPSAPCRSPVPAASPRCATAGPFEI
nr:MAG TPA: hypothetical protein [Caudoviricetes sp.]